MANVTEIVNATFEAKRRLSVHFTPIPGIDLIEVLADAIVQKGLDGMNVDEVEDLCVTVGKQRIAAM